MKTKVLFIILIVFTFFCKAQNKDFSQFINNFGNTDLPISKLDNNKWNKVIYQKFDNDLKRMMPKSIPEKYVAKFICTGGFCNPDGGYYEYDYCIKIPITDDFYTLLIRKCKDEGDSDWNFDLTEILLITYSKSGKILSRKSLSKDNGVRWQSNLTITKEKILVQQIKNTAPKVSLEKIMPCEVWTTEYQISGTGIIEVKNVSPKENAKIKWDDKLLKYELIN